MRKGASTVLASPPLPVPGQACYDLGVSLPKLYLETTIPSYLAARRSRDLRLAADQETTEEWWETRRHEYELFTSQVVEVEIGEGEAAMAAARLRLLDNIPRLPAQPEVEELIENLLESGIVPASAAPDAAHIAFAAVHELDFLLTWNCKHINNPHLIRRIERACAERGLACPVICTPEELLPL